MCQCACIVDSLAFGDVVSGMAIYVDSVSSDIRRLQDQYFPADYPKVSQDQPSRVDGRATLRNPSAPTRSSGHRVGVGEQKPCDEYFTASNKKANGQIPG